MPYYQTAYCRSVCEDTWLGNLSTRSTKVANTTIAPTVTKAAATERLAINPIIRPTDAIYKLLIIFIKESTVALVCFCIRLFL